MAFNQIMEDFIQENCYAKRLRELSAWQGLWPNTIAMDVKL